MVKKKPTIKKKIAPIVANTNTSSLPAKKIKWFDASELFSDKIFKIRTPRGHGTGFHIGDFGTANRLSAVATALHVVEEEEKWDQPIKLEHEASKRLILLKDDAGGRVIFTYPESDLAIIVFPRPKDFKIENPPIDHIKPQTVMRSGAEVGWLGFPGLMGGAKLCFFHGYISCGIKNGYLVDGVAINGVSGGPVFYISSTRNAVVVAGVITAYVPNRSSRDTLPGLSMIASVSPYENTIKMLKTIDEANKEAQKQKKARKQKNPNNEESLSKDNITTN